ncbi:MAG: class I SAM-dependent methyltransferase [Verrucomicrobia bacterium]|nr:class I SAM-dependent methyltransferase [Verrucomicrobiota bacterium]
MPRLLLASARRGFTLGAMAHSVSGHLKLRVAEYDELIRRLVPAYPAMRPVQLDLLALALPDGGACPERSRRVLDLGGGTGALAAAIAERFPGATVEIWDTDPEMLAVSRERCAPFGDRVRYVERSFTDPLPPCDAVAACIALHHVKDLTVKAGIYQNIHAALRPGGIFVNADTAVCATPALRDHAFRLWAASMRPHGIGEKEACAHFASWAHEDYYPPLITELRMLADAGFAEPECFWREAAAVVFGAVK